MEWWTEASSRRGQAGYKSDIHRIPPAVARRSSARKPQDWTTRSSVRRRNLVGCARSECASIDRRNQTDLKAEGLASRSIRYAAGVKQSGALRRLSGSYADALGCLRHNFEAPAPIHPPV